MTEYQKGRERGYELGKLTASDTIQALADTIEALRAEIDALCVVNARLTKEAMSDYHEGLEEGCAAMKEENAKLREALNGLSKAFVERLIGMGCFVADIHKDKDYRAARKAMGDSDE